MAEKTNPPSGEEKQVTAYNRMLERMKHFIDEAEKEFAPKFQHSLDYAKEKATELGELTREEAEKIGNYLRRDIVDAAEYLSGGGGELRQWLRFDLELIENRILEKFALVADQTKLELNLLADQARRMDVWRTGEITGIGSLECDNCGEIMHFHKTGHIPPCPKCKGTTFRRVKE
jgi:hypothetical protein